VGVLVVVAVAEVEPDDVDPGLQGRDQLVAVVEGRPERGDDLGLPHDGEFLCAFAGA
jgi:hypothetical protein